MLFLFFFGGGGCVFLDFVFLLFSFFFGGFKGQVRWPKGPPHVALNPPFFCFGFCCCCFFLGGGGLFVFVLFGGFKGQVRWPFHLALNPY